MVFQGKEIIAGTEESHSWVNGGHLDYYSETKNQAEKLVIEANGKCSGNQSTPLKTCVLRYFLKFQILTSIKRFISFADWAEFMVPVSKRFLAGH